jgi:hypothetical protein
MNRMADQVRPQAVPRSSVSTIRYRKNCHYERPTFGPRDLLFVEEKQIPPRPEGLVVMTICEVPDSAARGCPVLVLLLD